MTALSAPTTSGGRHLRRSPTRPARAAFARFWPYARRDRRFLVLAGLGLVVAAACETGGIWMFQIITDDALEKGDLSAFWWPASIWLGLVVVGGLFTFGGQYLSAWVAERFLLKVRTTVFGHVQRLAPDFFARRGLGDLVTRLTGDIEAVEHLVASGLVETATSAITIVFFAGAALYLRWELALAAFAAAPVFWLVSRRFTGPFTDATEQERASSSAISSVVEESFANVALVQAYNRQDSEGHRLHREGVEWLRAKLTEARLSAVYSPIVQIVETVAILAIIGMGTWELSADRMTLGGLLAFAAYLGYLYPPIQNLGHLTISLQAAAVSARRLGELLDTEPAVADPTSPQVFPFAAGHVAFEGVAFQYPGTDSYALADVSFTAYPGELVVITGPSGAGKSTVAKLLLRFYDPHAGRVQLDRVEVTELTLDNLRSKITLLPQEIQLFHGTIASNIAYGKPGATREDIIAAARAADAHEFIEALPEGYDTPVGHRGQQLSGGQRQRIAVARAMVRNTPVLILDEPTTGLDTASAQRILAPLRRLMAGRTTILITHDLRLAPDADRIVMLSSGRVVEQGTHWALIAAGGPYSRLYHAQAS